jgi:carbon monoxide dehydrogenase subunit G
MKLAAAYTLAVPPEKVFSALTDPAVLEKCIEGCERLQRTGEDSYDAHLKIGIAGLKGSYTGKVQLKDKKPPESFTLVMEGKGVPGFVRGTAAIRLSASGGGTELRCESDAQVGGLIAAVGSRLIEAAARRMMDDFFRKFAAQIGPA